MKHKFTDPNHFNLIEFFCVAVSNDPRCNFFITMNCSKRILSEKRVFFKPQQVKPAKSIVVSNIYFLRVD